MPKFLLIFHYFYDIIYIKGVKKMAKKPKKTDPLSVYDKLKNFFELVALIVTIAGSVFKLIRDILDII